MNKHLIPKERKMKQTIISHCRSDNCKRIFLAMKSFLQKLNEAKVEIKSIARIMSTHQKLRDLISVL